MTKLRTHRLFTLVSPHSRDGGGLEKLSLPAMICIVVLFCAAAVIAARAQNVFFTTLANFDGANGAGLSGPLVLASDGNFYGTANGGGSYSEGTVFKITPSGVLTSVYSFCAQTGCPDGNGPLGGVVRGTDGNLYGVTQYGGSYDNGTVFKITATGTLTTLYSFCAQAGCTDGSQPLAGLVQATDGNFYGTTEGGGTNYNCEPGCGTVFTITSSGAFTTLYDFSGPDGFSPYAGLVLGSDGNFYGVTQSGGSSSWCNSYGVSGCGTVFTMTPGGMLTTLHSFDLTDGAGPSSALVQVRNGALYGTTNGGGADGDGTVFRIGVVHTCATCRP